ncbi:MAG: RNA polymerase sigma factor [Calditrichia bacterium]
MEDERQKVEQILTGDKGLFKSLIDDYQRLVTHIVFRMVPNETDQEEVCQEVFIKVYQNLSSFQFKSKLSTWIGRIAYNTAINYLKKKKLWFYEDSRETINNPAMPDNDGLHKKIDDVRGRANGPDEEAMAGEIAGLLYAELQKLPIPYRTAITLYHLDNMSYEEIGGIMSLPSGTVKSYLFRGRKLLKEKLLQTYRIEDFLP